MPKFNDLDLENWKEIDLNVESLWNIEERKKWPKDKLYYDDIRITNECKKCEPEIWKNKDIIYTIWVSPNKTNKIKLLWFIYWDCYCANKEVYTRISDKISNWIKEISDVDFIETNELAKVKKVDPLWITDLRVRWMWHIENPINVFKEISKYDENHNFVVNAIILEEKYFSFPELDRLRLENMQNDFFKIMDIEIKSPNNPAKLLKAKFISYIK